MNSKRCTIKKKFSLHKHWTKGKSLFFRPHSYCCHMVILVSVRSYKRSYFQRFTDYHLNCVLSKFDLVARICRNSTEQQKFWLCVPMKETESTEWDGRVLDPNTTVGCGPEEDCNSAIKNYARSSLNGRLNVTETNWPKFWKLVIFWPNLQDIFQEKKASLITLLARLDRDFQFEPPLRKLTLGALSSKSRWIEMSLTTSFVVLVVVEADLLWPLGTLTTSFQMDGLKKPSAPPQDVLSAVSSL